ncbi:UV-stimulated scaffold protein A isoform X2 [Genypterus blacodes]|uniref:UV-stimulated scaffold protein A isoform X2 n=1 Tax=Genypterus blacodes TaxID=154954 RepID=UPI003F76F41E
MEQRETLSELVEQLTTSGQVQLNQDKMKQIKKICKESLDSVDHVYHSLMSQLSQEHAEVRLSAFQIAAELFARSHHFRTRVVDNFQEFLKLTVETDSEEPLPPPKEVAKKLKVLAIRTVQSWQATYGSAYKKLALGYHFLKQVKKVDFQDVEARTVAERRSEEERQQRLERIYKERVEAAATEMEDSREEIQATLTEIESCMKLLSPEFEPLDLQAASSSSPNTADEDAGDKERPCCSKDLKDKREDIGDGEEDKSHGGKKEEKDEGEDRTAREKTDKEEERDLKPQRGEKGEEEDGGSGQEEEEGLNEDSFIRDSGLMSHSYTLDLNLSPGLHIKETEDNEAVVSTVIDLHKVITTKHLPAVQNWVQIFTRSGADQQLLRTAVDLKRSLKAALLKHKELHIDCKTRVRRVMKASADSEDEDDDDDFQEVPEKEGFEPHIPEHLWTEYGLDPSPSTSSAPLTRNPPMKRPAAPPSSFSISSSKRQRRLAEEEQDPTSAAATLRLLRQNRPQPTTSTASSTPSASSTSCQKSDAPVVPFGLDLYYWGQDQPSAGKIIKSASQHQFWVPIEMEEEVENEELEAEGRSRYISFPGSFVPVSHYCRAPLDDGKLCQRQDRLKCPFHGRIVPRDGKGRPCKQEDRLREEQEERRKREEQPDWRDAELMRDIEAATGEDLGSERLSKNGKRKKKKKYPNLSDLKQNANTARSRLQRKVFNKSSMRRVSQVLSKADRRKHEKFSNQFNYALD